MCAAGNPLAPAQNFTVFVEENAVFGNAETEDSLALGGKLSWTRDYPVIHTSGLTPTNYDLPAVNGVPLRVAAGELDFASSNDQLKVTSSSAVTPEHHGHLQVGQVDWNGHWARGGGKELRLTESSSNQDAGTGVYEQLKANVRLAFGGAVEPNTTTPLIFNVQSAGNCVFSWLR